MEEWFSDWFDEDYAALYAHRDGEEAAQSIRTALRLAPELASGPVLDLGCGSGRHLAPLLEANPQVYGMDLSPHLLRRAPKAMRGRLLRADMRHLPFKPDTFSGVCLWFTPFGYFQDTQNQALLHHLARILKPGGILLLDFFNAHSLPSTLVPEDTWEQGGLQVRNRRSIEGNRLIKRMAIHRRKDGTTREITESVRIYTPEELQAMATFCGLTLCCVAGNYAGEPFEPSTSKRWIGYFLKKVNG